MVEDAYKRWMELGSKYCQDQDTLESIWKQLLKNYTARNRHYHSLDHIYAMLLQAEKYSGDLQDKDVVDFAIWFHDIIYKSTRKDNEEKSADFAKQTLEKFSIESDRIEKVYNLIISTKKHQLVDSNDTDNVFLLDFDLSILGKPWEVYENYIREIRKEYKVYPNLLYKPGRKKVLETFLERKTLYFTEEYQELYERQARENLKKEIQGLN